MSDLLRLKNLKIWLNSGQKIIRAVDGVDFSIKPKQTYALLGESGSGKTVTALSICQLLSGVNFAKISGEILFNGKDLLSQSESYIQNIRGKKIGFIFQEPMSALNPVLTVEQQIREIADNKDTQSIVKLLDSVGLKNPDIHLKQYPHELSGGMRQRVMIAMALSTKPELLIADEPTTALDVTTQAQILTLLKSLQRKYQMALLFITHDLAVASEIADKIGVMYAGKIIEQNTPEILFNNPQHPYTMKLLKSLPSFEKRGSYLESTKKIVNKKNVQKTDTDLLSVKNLSVNFPIKKGIFRRTVANIKAVQQVNLNLQSAKTHALVGESGSGKSTLAKTLVGLNPNFQGDIFYQNRLLNLHHKTDLRFWRHQVQIIFQDPYSAINPRMMVKDIVDEGAVALGKWHGNTTKKVIALLKQVGLDGDILERYPHEFSGGQRQRIVIARALAISPKILICDEPTSALDVSVQAQVLNLFKELQQNLGLSYLFITHNLHAVAWLADEISVMRSGKIVESGSTETILKNPQHWYTKSLINALPEIKK